MTQIRKIVTRVVTWATILTKGRLLQAYVVGISDIDMLWDFYSHREILRENPHSLDIMMKSSSTSVQYSVQHSAMHDGCRIEINIFVDMDQHLCGLPSDREVSKGL